MGTQTEESLLAMLETDLSGSDQRVSPVPSLAPGMWRTFTTATCTVIREYNYQLFEHLHAFKKLLNSPTLLETYTYMPNLGKYGQIEK